MAYNFKSIADVEVVEKPTNAANVLIEENGVVKKAPKSAVGGAGGGGLYVCFNEDNWTITHAPDDLYNTIKAMYDTCDFTPINIMLYYHTDVNLRSMSYMESRDDYFYIYYDGGYALEVYPDGTIEFMSYD